MVFRPKFNSEDNISDDSIYDQESFRTLILLGFGCILYGCSVGINLSSFSMYLSKFDLDSKEISHILSLEILGNITAAPFMLMLVRRLGVYKIVLLSLALRNFFLAFFGFGSDNFTWYIGMFGFGVSGFVLYTSLFQWINSIIGSKFRATYLSIASVCFGLGIALGPVLMVLFDIDVGNETFLISLCICMLMAVPILMTEKSKLPVIYTSSLSINQVFKYAYIPVICAIAGEYVFFSISEFLPLYALAYDKPQYEAYLLVSYFGFSGLILGIPFGMIIDKFDRVRIIMMFSLVIAILVQLIPIVMDNIYLTILVFAPLSACINGIIVGGLAILGDKFRGDEFVAANTTVHAMSTIGGYAGIKTTGNLMSILGDKGLIYSISSLFLVFLALLVLKNFTIKIK
jgi:MFS family permease